MAVRDKLNKVFEFFLEICIFTNQLLLGGYLKASRVGSSRERWNSLHTCSYKCGNEIYWSMGSIYRFLLSVDFGVAIFREKWHAQTPMQI